MTNPSNEDQIRALVENWANAIRQKDMDGALAYHSDDILMFDAPLPLQSQGMAAYQKTWEHFFALSPGGDGTFDVTELNITASDTVAFCHALVSIFDSKVRLTMGFRKLNGLWMIAHEHHSYPIEMPEAS